MAMNFVAANSEAIGFGDLTAFDMGAGDLDDLVQGRRRTSEFDDDDIQGPIRC